MPQWNAFAEALRANARRMSGMHETMMQGGMINQGNAAMSAPDRLDRMEIAMTAMLEGLKEMKATSHRSMRSSPTSRKKRLISSFMGPWAWVGCDYAGGRPVDGR